MESLIGCTLGGRYRILERVGGGGMGHVYKARCQLLDRTVAVKVLNPALAEDQEFLRRFRREARAAASLSHPNVVSVYDVGQQGDIHYLVMEFLEGEDLKRYIKRGRPSVREALMIARQIAQALAHAHQQGLIHRDIKPHNILLTAYGTVKVTDFGIARAAVPGATLTYEGTIIGSVHYISPEQARGEPAGPRSDLYSLGVVLYEMLTGKVPFHGTTALGVAMQHLRARPRAPRELDPSIPAAVNALVLKALEKDPDRRFQTAEEMVRAIDACLEQLSRQEAEATTGYNTKDRAKPRPPREEVETVPKTRKRRRKARAARILVVLLVLALLGAGGWYGWQRFMDWYAVPTVLVPDVVGQSVVQAERTLWEVGLRGTVVAERSDPDIPAGQIIAQDPAAGETVRRGRLVRLVVSTGPQFVEEGVPDVVGMTWRDAALALDAVGLKVGEIARQYHEEIGLDRVIAQNPKAGTRVVEGTAVDLVLSLGPPPPLVTVPRLEGATLEQAKVVLEQAGLLVGQLQERESWQPAGTVIAQDPEAGTRVPQGSTVNLVLSKGPPSGTKRTTLRIEVPSTSRVPVTVRVVLVDISGPRVVYNAKHHPGEIIELPVAWAGQEAQAKIYFNGQLAIEKVLR